MTAIKITSKRQATFPVELCDALGIKPGDELVLEPLFIKGEPVWALRQNKASMDWMGSLRKYAHNKSHNMKDIQRSVAHARSKEHWS